mmetsp:Transcript_18369/g.55334  ORF Transcript_18369/g.55334 Transcript_18369/m.55334 type:complete len:127 (-) Transcript_18369:752-1132(-)
MTPLSFGRLKGHVHRAPEPLSGHVRPALMAGLQPLINLQKNVVFSCDFFAAAVMAAAVAEAVGPHLETQAGVEGGLPTRRAGSQHPPPECLAAAAGAAAAGVVMAAVRAGAGVHVPRSADHPPAPE